ncbi:hypothetical protein C8Q76DRAFT_799515 [Earliella scabrosa]|nr:hypothetical protein C8Q76DRAFT_799515 [Earliella scabrosa]
MRPHSRTKLTVITALAAVAAANPPVVNPMIDDSDSRILYTGSWVKNPIDDPENFNYAGSLSFTNISTAIATFSFEGAEQVAVYGSFPVAGTFVMKSQYDLDGKTVATFMPPGTITKSAYRQPFFSLGSLSTGKHTLVITNLGNAFYLDYIQLHMASLPSSTIVTHAPSAPTSAPPPAPAQSTPPASNVADTGGAQNTPSATSTAAAPPGTPSASQSPTSSINTSLTSSGTSGDVSAPSSSPSMTTSSLPARSPSDAASASSAASGAGQRSGGLMTGAYVAIGVAGFVLLLCLLGGGALWYRRRRRRGHAITNQSGSRVSPFGLTSLATDSEKRGLDLSSSDGHSHMHFAVHHAGGGAHVPPYSEVDALQSLDSRSRRSTVRGGAGSEYQRRVAEEMDEDTSTPVDGPAYEPLASPSAASPLISRQRRSSVLHGESRDERSTSLALSPNTASPATPVSKTRRMRLESREDEPIPEPEPESEHETTLAAGLAACDDLLYTVDDADPRIQYHGPWTKNPIDDPKHVNSMGTLSLSNVSQTTATFVFHGVKKIAVFGALPVAGTFIMKSQYSIDGKVLETFMPPSTISRAEYRRMFFSSGTLSLGEHTLEIRNLGEAFYLDYFVVHRSSFTPTNPTQSDNGSLTSERSEAPISATSSPTSEDTKNGSSMEPWSSASRPSTSSEGEGPGAVPQQRSSSVTAGAYIAIGVAGFILFVCLVGGACLWHCRRSCKRDERRNVHPFDPGLTSAPVDLEKHARGRALGSHELATISTTGSAAPPYSSADVDELLCDGRTSRRTVLADELANGEVDVGRTERTEVGSREHYALAPLRRTSPLISPFRRSLDHDAGSSTGTGSAHTTRPPTSTARWKTCAASARVLYEPASDLQHGRLRERGSALVHLEADLLALRLLGSRFALAQRWRAYLLDPPDAILGF